MTVDCERCGRAFKSQYAVFGHRRACRGPRQAQPASRASEPAQPGLAVPLSPALASEQVELQRRRMALQRRELERAESSAAERDLHDLRMFFAKEDEARTRRDVVEQVCPVFADSEYARRGYRIPFGTAEIAKRRAGDAVEHAPAGSSREKLLTIAEQARDEIYAPIVRVQDAARAAAAAADAAEEARRMNDAAQAQRSAERMIAMSLPPRDNPVAPAVEPDMERRQYVELDEDGDREFDDDIDPPDEPDEYHDPDTDRPQQTAAGLGTLLVVFGFGLAGAALYKAWKSSTLWIADPLTGGDGSFAMGSEPPGPTPPWREASAAEIEQGIASGALRPV